MPFVNPHFYSPMCREVHHRFYTGSRNEKSTVFSGNEGRRHQGFDLGDFEGQGIVGYTDGNR